MFITNGLILFLSNNRYVVGDISGRTVDDLSPRMESGWRLDLWFSADLRYGIARGVSTGYDVAIVDATALRRWLDGLGLLFHATTAVVNAPEVRVRENPNLQAYVFGTVGRGDVVAVLDRSGVKERIGDTEDWWYGVRRTRDGLEGWMYGAFLDSMKGE